MVICLRCGWCCKNISPFVTGNEDRETPLACPYLKYEDNIYTCTIYQNRPDACKNEHMGAGESEPCPIGLLAMNNNEIEKPTGKCMYCGSHVYNRNLFCNDKCESEFIKNLQ